MLTVGKMVEALSRFDADCELPLLELVRMATVSPLRPAARAVRKTLPPPEQTLNRHNALQALPLGDLFPVWLDVRHATRVAAATAETANAAASEAENDEHPIRDRLARVLLAEVGKDYPRRRRERVVRFDGVTVRASESEGNYHLEILPVEEVPLDAGKTLPPDPPPSEPAPL